MNSIIQTRGLSRRFGRTLAVDSLSLEVPKGSIFALLGPNGAGKTTTIKMLLNMIRPTGGRAMVLGTESTRLGPEEFSRIGYVSENQELPDWMSVQELLDFCRPMYPSWDQDLCRHLIRQFDLPLSQTIKSFSRGMKIKAALLSSLAYRPELVVLDEPFSGLDALVRDEFMRGLLELSGRTEWTVLVSSHDIDEVERLVDWVGVIDKGSLRVSESVSSLERRFRRCQLTLASTDELPERLPPSWLLPKSVGRTVRFVESEYRERTSVELIRSLVPAARDVTASRMSLKEIFMALARTYRSQRKEQG
ncbi:MAG: ABC transporter ATP-binding protein [Bryobacterales bacterium]|nr:ABC transporter ATP-binding protein [Bryobacterales bacterium]